MKAIKDNMRCGFLISFAFFVFGFFLYFGIAGFSFIAYICFGIGFIVLCYQLLKLMAIRFPTARRILWWCLSAGLCLGLFAAGITGIFIANAASGTADPACDYVIVLGAGVNGSTPSYILRTRINAAFEYLRTNEDAICIVSGGQGNHEDISEAQCMFDELTQMGISPARIWLEDKATTTQENIAFSLLLIQEKTGSRPQTVGLITNDFHLYRASLFAHEQSITVIGIPAETGWLSLEINYFLREIVGVWKFLVFGA